MAVTVLHRCVVCTKTFKDEIEAAIHYCPEQERIQERANYQAIPEHKHSHTLNALDRIKDFINFEISKLERDK